VLSLLKTRGDSVQPGAVGGSQAQEGATRSQRARATHGSQPCQWGMEHGLRFRQFGQRPAHQVPDKLSETKSMLHTSLTRLATVSGTRSLAARRTFLRLRTANCARLYW